MRVVELRNYLLHPGRRDELIALFEREFIEPQEASGMRLLGLFHDAQRPDHFVWIRGFANMDRRKEALGRFYDGPVWRRHRDAANATMADSDNVLLLRPVRPDASLLIEETIDARGPLLCSMQFFASSAAAEAAARDYETSTALHLSCQGASTLGTFVTEAAANSFPRLPVREGQHAFVVLTSGISRNALRAEFPSAEILELVPTARSRVRLLFAGKPGDFDFLVGMTTVTHCKLRERLRGSGDWESATGAYRCVTLAGGVVNVDEIGLPEQVRGCSIRHLDIAARRWAIYWTTSRTGALLPPVYGGFRGDQGEFYGNDVENGRDVLARYVWSNCTTPRPRWEQAFSTDGGQTWETNWIMEFSR